MRQHYLSKIPARSGDTGRSIIALILLLVVTSSIHAEDRIQFNRDVRAILSDKCFTCHGPDAAHREAGLRLDDPKSAFSKLESDETAIVPGKPSASELIKRITSDDDDLRMPPADSGKTLTAKQIDTLTKWVEQGAEYQEHWAFVSVQPTLIPAVSARGWQKNAIDNFVALKFAADYQPAKQASRIELIRRVAFDVTGLPPTLEEIDLFTKDQSDDAYAKMVDRYLSSKAYGEHMATYWMDLARYADTNGYQYDTERQQWVWRDWVIDAYNRNMPFDQFTIQQLAGDLIENATPQQRLGSAFNRNHGITIEGGVIDEEYRTEYVMDRLTTTGTVWLGLTVGCARCHDHKFDPLSQKEFYQMFAFFNQVAERGQSGFNPKAQIPSPLALDQQKQNNGESAKLTKEIELATATVARRAEAWAQRIANTPQGSWSTVKPETMNSTGKSTLTIQDDNSILIGGANSAKDVVDASGKTQLEKITAVRMECLTHPSLPGGGPGRHTNSNFVLSEFELEATSIADPKQKKTIKFASVESDYSQKGYEIHKSIDGTVANSNGWAVDGPTRKKPATAIFYPNEPFGFAGGTTLRFRLRHEASFGTHGIGRPRFSVTSGEPSLVSFKGIPAEIIDIAKKKQAGRSAAEQSKLSAYFAANYDTVLKQLKLRLTALQNQKASAFPATMVMQDMPQMRPTFVLNRGQYNERKAQVSAGTPAILSNFPADAPRNRLGFAQWLTSPDHPLTARVAVNRYWQNYFGIGLVKTVEDFGVQGEPPSHPMLLDYLAHEFVKSGWNVKQMQRLILNSATYRQTSHVGAEAYRADPENRRLARGPRLRLTAEQIRDGALAVSGLLVNRVGGRSVYPYQPDGLWLELNNRPGYSKKYQRGTGDALYRRSLYTFWKRTVPSPMLKTFDAPTREFCTVQRSRTNTPLQSLLLLNGPQFVEAARGLGTRMIQSGEETTESRIAHGFRLVTARPPAKIELEILAEELAAARTRYKNDLELAKQINSVGDSPPIDSIEPAELAAWTSLARLIMNLDEAVTKD
ncbi:MAG: hypothetical protein ACI9G1_004983 [Pirellulaceae bacterium]|jgi:hypothetical protein